MKQGSRVERVADGLRAAIAAGDYASGGRLPPESQLATKFEVSRPTVRAALRELEATGLVRTQHGVGSFVSDAPAVTAGLERLDSISESIRGMGRQPGMRYKSRTVRPLMPEEAARLGTTADAMALELRRSILADGEVVAYSYDLMPIGVFPEDENPEVIQDSLFSYLRQERDLHPHHAVARVHAVASDHIGWDVPASQPPLYVLLDQVHYDRDETPLLYSRTYFLEGRYEFTIMRRP